MADGPKGEHLELLQEAQALQIDTTPWAEPNANLDSLRVMIGRQTAALAREAIAKRNIERAVMDEADAELETIRGAFDETMANTRGVLVRQVEWSEWLPVSQDAHEPRLTIANGVSGFEAGENERVLSVDGVGTQIFKHVEGEQEGSGQRFMLYAFKATLAQNVHTTLIPTLVEAQGSNQQGEEQVKRPSGIITPNGPGPNRQARRHPNG
jgi:hypothetical protein